MTSRSCGSRCSSWERMWLTSPSPCRSVGSLTSGRARVQVLGHLFLVCAYLCVGGPINGPLVTALSVPAGGLHASTDGVLVAATVEARPVEPAGHGDCHRAVRRGGGPRDRSARPSAGCGSTGRESAVLIISVALALAVLVAWALVRALLPHIAARQDARPCVDRRRDRRRAGAYLAWSASRAAPVPRALRPARWRLSRVVGRPHIVFRNTPGRNYGRIGMVTIADPRGPRAITAPPATA